MTFAEVWFAFNEVRSTFTKSPHVLRNCPLVFPKSPPNIMTQRSRSQPPPRGDKDNYRHHQKEPGQPVPPKEPRTATATRECWRNHHHPPKRAKTTTSTEGGKGNCGSWRANPCWRTERGREERRREGWAPQQPLLEERGRERQYSLRVQERWEGSNSGSKWSSGNERHSDHAEQLGSNGNHGQDHHAEAQGSVATKGAGRGNQCVEQFGVRTIDGQCRTDIIQLVRRLLEKRSKFSHHQTGLDNHRDETRKIFFAHVQVKRRKRMAVCVCVGGWSRVFVESSFPTQNKMHGCISNISAFASHLSFSP